MYYSITMSRIVIVAQNLNIGGFQRIALDQCYALSERKISVELILLERMISNERSNFISLEKDLIQKYQVDIKYFTGGRLNQFTLFYKMLNQSSESINFLSHSLRATVLIRLAGLLKKKCYSLSTTIHQIPSLSDPWQLKKRFFYALFSHRLFIFSAQAKQDWEARVSKSLLLRILFSTKPIQLLRNGVFLARLPTVLMSSPDDCRQDARLVFIGRPTYWKGVDTILRLVDRNSMDKVLLLFFFPYMNEHVFSNVPDRVLERISIEMGKSVREYAPKLGDIHLYPTNYGIASSYVESISINCLEMSAIGVPSLVTRGGLSTWPEFANSPLIQEVDWSNLEETAGKILDIHRYSIPYEEILRFRSLIDINKHIDQLLTLTEN